MVPGVATVEEVVELLGPATVEEVADLLVVATAEASGTPGAATVEEIVVVAGDKVVILNNKHLETVTMVVNVDEVGLHKIYITRV